MSSYARQQLEGWIGSIHVPKESRVLDVGGSQLSVQGRLGSVGEGSTYKTLDLPVPHEGKPEPDIKIDLNCANPSILDMVQYSSYFDVAFCLEVSEYLWNPVGAFRTIADLLTPGGKLYVSFHFVYPEHKPFEDDSLRYTKTGIRKILEATGFEIVDIKPRVSFHNALLNGFYSAEMMRGKLDSNEVGYLVTAKKKSI